MFRFAKWIVPIAAVARLSFGGTVLCTESDSSGCVQQLFNTESGPNAIVASDGESSFDPFGVGSDTSDQIQFTSANWLPESSNGWTQFNSTTWFAPASSSCGSENEPSCEATGAWYLPGVQWSEGQVGVYTMLDSDGVTISDVIVLDNAGPDGSAEIQFSSDPTLIPEPASLGLVGLGALGLAALRRRRAHRA